MDEAADSACGGETRLVSLLGGKLTLRQPNGGHRVGTDAILLAAAVTPNPGDCVLDVGSGIGSVGLAIALRCPAAKVRLLESVPDLARLARHNVAACGFENRVGVEEADVFAASPPSRVLRADWVVSNPPFQLASGARPSPDALRAKAHRLDAGRDHGDWLRAMLRHGAPKGAVVLIHRPDALSGLLGAAEGRLGRIRVLPVHAREDSPAIRILFGGVIGSRSPLAILPPLVLHGPGGVFLPGADAIHRGTAVIDLLRPTKNRP